ncbi:MAG: hypothetical protein LBV33_05425 [Lachnospiraceae bacterium]|jgi:hypothetical protein|nr:hypothetical protein [Lachnospiraceae bacterium]
MKYFILEQAEDYQRGPTIREWYGKLDAQHLEMAPMSAENRMVFNIEVDEFTIFPDIITFPCLMVSEEMHQILLRYDSRIPYRDVFFLESEKMIGKIYFIPFLPEMDCLTEDSILSPDRSRVEKGVVDTQKFWDRPIIEVSGVTNQCVAINLDLAEALIGEGMIGIGLRELESAVK